MPERPPLPVALALGSGLLMGTADSVPGVSGGTIALVIGVYERLVTSLDDLLRLPARWRDRRARGRARSALRFLLPLGVGIAAALYVSTRLLVGPDDQPGWLRVRATAPLCYGFFFGLVLFSLREPWGRIARPGASRWIVAVIACAVTAWVVGLEHAGGRPEWWMLLYGGALAVAVMLLPGISGSLLLLALGQYVEVTGAIHEPGSRWKLLVFGAGMLVGLAAFVPLLRRLLRQHRDLTLAALSGLMAGSLRALWPWKASYDVKDPTPGRLEPIGVQSDWPWVLLALVAGALATWLLARLERRIGRVSSSDLRPRPRSLRRDGS